MSKRLDCLGLGIAPIDILMQIKRFPSGGRTGIPSYGQVEAFLKRGAPIHA